MESAVGITMYDMVVLGLFSLLIGRGIWLGLLKQVTGLLALYIGYLVASQYHDKFFPFLREVSDNPQIVFLVSYVIMFIATYIVIMLLGKMLTHAVQVSIVGWFDRVLGGVVGFLQALIVVVLMHMILGSVLPPENKMLKTCETCGVLNEAVDVTREMIKNEDVRKALQQKKPAIALDAFKEYLEPISSKLLGKKEKDTKVEAKPEE
ncbi:CvpA family protein [Desulfosediminicola flagellatus]|uniref:CvpA family protein n=1 Tax=Desulfosediminicola flagellatus TaxID=2569541 RepID=UPI00142F2731|nr:CvpA family protein [Desulfosediminicola flagellatus]